MDIKAKIREIQKNIKIIFWALKEKDTPLISKIFAFLAVSYALSPIDLIPDFIPVLGYIDDLIILPFLIYLSFKFIPKDILKKCREKAENTNLPEKKWYYGLIIIFIWAFILIFIKIHIIDKK